MPAPAPTIWIVEDDDGYRDALAPAVRQAFGSVEEALAWAAVAPSSEAPEVVLFDVNLPGMTGIAGLARLKASLTAARFVMLTIRDDAATVYAARGSGAGESAHGEVPGRRIV